MSRFWVTVQAVLLVSMGMTILVIAVVTGAWLGALWGMATLGATADWLRLRKSTESAQVVADRMIAATSFGFLGVAIFALRHLDKWDGD
jgi:hypothetical protein